MRDRFKFFENSQAAMLYDIFSGNYYRLITDEYKIPLREYLFSGKENAAAETILQQVSVEEPTGTVATSECECGDNCSGRTLERLVILLTNVCNLDCVYCYAHGGSYGYATTDILNQAKTNQILEYFTSNFQKIRAIQFFGGEPTTNSDMIKYICEHFLRLHNARKIDYTPQFGMVTNGYQMDDDLLDFIVKHNFTVTFSIDGPEFIHDKLRPTKGQGKSYASIEANFDKLIAKGLDGKRIGIECTYTAEHIRQGVSLIQLVQFFHERYGVPLPHIVPVSVDETSDLNIQNYLEQYDTYLRELVDFTFDHLISEGVATTDDLVFRAMQLIMKQAKSPVVCPGGGLGTMSVAFDGSIYPCFMFTSCKNLSYGTIEDDIETILQKSNEFIFAKNMKDKYTECKTCWVRRGCASCLGEFLDREAEDLTRPNGCFCFTNRKMFEYVLLNIGRIKADQEKWNKFLELCAVTDVEVC